MILGANVLKGDPMQQEIDDDGGQELRMIQGNQRDQEAFSVAPLDGSHIRWDTGGDVVKDRRMSSAYLILDRFDVFARLMSILPMRTGASELTVAILADAIGSPSAATRDLKRLYPLAHDASLVG
jgi:hypothetical protein